MESKIFKFISKFSYLFSAVAVLILFSVLFALNDIYPFGVKTVSWCDMDQQTIPLLCDLKDILSGKQSLFLSLQNAGGMNFYGVYFFNLSSPFTYLILFFDKTQMPLAVNVMVVLKLATAALTFSIWLKSEIKNCSPFIIIPFAITYAFSGYSMMYYQILSWLDVLYVFPLILLGLKNITEQKSVLLYVLSLFACVLCHFYISWAVIIFICLYAGVYCLFNSENAKPFAVKFVIGSIITALLSCIVLLPCFLQYTHSMRGSDIISNLKNETFNPPYHTSLPTFFCLALSLPFVFYFKKNQALSEKIVLFFLMLIPAFVEPISMAFQTYDYMSFPTRYGFITIVLGLTLGAQNLNKLLNENPFNKKFLENKYFKVATVAISVICVALCSLFINYSFKFLGENTKDLTAYSSTLWGNKTSFTLLIKYYAIILVIGAILYVLARFKCIRKIGVYAVIAILCIIEAIFSCSIYMVAPSHTYEEFKGAISIENTIEDSEFFRVKTYSKYFDVNLIGAIGYNSMSHYTSLNRESYMLMAKYMGYSSYWMEVNSNGGTTFTDALMRNKYEIKSNSTYNSKPVIPENAVVSSDKYSVLKNGTVLPFGFLIESGAQANDNLSLPRWKIQNNLAMRFLGVSLYEEVEPQTLHGIEIGESNKNYCYNKTSNESCYLYYDLKIIGKKSVYFDCFDRYSNSLREATYNAVSSVRVYNANGSGMSYGSYPTQARNGVLNLGTFENTSVRIYVYLNNNINFNSFGVFTLDEDALENAINQSIGGDFEFKNGKISGKITAKNSGEYVLFCMPYDEGYTARVNGEKTKVENINGLIAVKLESGENAVNISFTPEGLGLGVIAFLMGGVLLVIYLLFGKKLEKIKIVNNLCLIGVFALLIIVAVAVYLGPVAINLL